MTVRLKCWAESWDAIARGDKTADIRSMEDRTFAIGDVLELVRWDHRADVATGEIAAVRITHIDTMAGNVNLIGVRLASKTTEGTLLRLGVLSFQLLGARRE